jgi:diacylglycerol kinase (CTP)
VTLNDTSSKAFPPLQPTELKQRADIHLVRKIWHVLGVCSMILIYITLGTNWSIGILLAISAIIIPLDILRLKNPPLNALTIKIFGPVLRRHEYDSVSGMSYLFAGGLVLLLFFPRPILILSLLFLAFGDPLASYFGIRFGKDKIFGHKSLQGSAAAFVVCTLIAGLYYYYNNIMTERLLIVAPLSGLIAAIAELIPIRKLDDNFTFPVLSGCFLWLLFQLFSGFGV